MEHLLFKAKLAERAERYEEMTLLMNTVIDQLRNSEASEDIRNLVSVAYKNRVSEIRTSRRLLGRIEDIESAKGMHHGAMCVQEYRQQIEAEIIAKCDEAIKLASRMLENCSDVQGRTFLLKMKADYNRYIAELQTPRKDRAAEDAQKFYEDALNAGLSPEHHIMLGVALNKAIFFYEVLGKTSSAIELLETLLGRPGINGGDESNSSLIMNLIDDNLRLWQAGRS